MKHLGDICTLKGATDKKVVLKPFEEQGLIGLCAKSLYLDQCGLAVRPMLAAELL